VIAGLVCDIGRFRSGHSIQEDNTSVWAMFEVSVCVVVLHCRIAREARYFSLIQVNIRVQLSFKYCTGLSNVR